MPRVLVLGGGFGGLTVASDLAERRLPGVEVTLVDQRPSFVMGLVKLWVLDGRRRLEEQRHVYDRLRARGVRFVRGVVRGIDLRTRAVRVDAEEIGYDYLVIALGAEMAPEKLAGFAPTMDLYSEAGVEHLRRAIEEFETGRVVVMIASVPFKCPPAPYEAALLVEAMLRKRGVRRNAEVHLTTPEPYPLPVAPPEFGARLSELLARKGIQYSPDHHPTSIDPVKRLIHYENGAKVNYDLLLGVPMHRAPTVVREAGLTDASGWVPADAKTLATQHPDVWAVGDVVGVRLPNGKLLPKAGTLAAGQGYVVADQIASQVTGGRSAAAFEGRGVCYVETGDGLAISALGSFYHEPNPRFDFAAASAEGLRQKERFEADFMRRWFA